MGYQIYTDDRQNGKTDTMEHINQIKSMIQLTIKESEYIQAKQVANQQKLKTAFDPFFYTRILESFLRHPNQQIGKNKTRYCKENRGRNASKIKPNRIYRIFGIPEDGI